MDRRIAFGKKLRELRQIQGYSQEKLAAVSGLHRTYVGDVERGERNISLDNIWRLADALKINPAVFFEEDISSELISESFSDSTQNTQK